MTLDDSIKRWTAKRKTALEHGLINRFGTLDRGDSDFLLRSENGVRHGSVAAQLPTLHKQTLHGTGRQLYLKQEIITPHGPRVKMAWSSA